ncbi:MAG: tetratricopeptide repeat protein [Chloroflexota bacterium]
MSKDNMLQEAIEALEQGYRSKARNLLTGLLRADENNPDYWLWMSAAVETKKEQVFCLKKVLKLDPDDARARYGLTIHGELPPTEPVTPVPPPRLPIWTIEAQKGEPLTPRNYLRVLPYMGAGILLVALIMFGIFGNRLLGIWAGQAPTPTFNLPPTREPTATMLATSTQVVRSPTPTFTGPTPLWMLLEATYTPTPLYVNTPHPTTEAYRAALRAYAREDWDQVVVYMQQVLELEPTAVDAMYYLGEAYRHMGQYDQALTSYNHALTINPGFAPAYLGRVRVQLVKNPNADVTEDLNKALNADPNFGEAFLERALYYLKINQPEAALDDLRTAAELLADSPVLYYYRAQTLLALDDIEAALENAEYAHTLDFTLLPVYKLLGMLYLTANQPDKSLGYLQTHVLYQPDDAAAWVLLGKASFAKAGYTQAIAAFDQALDIDNSLSEAYLYRGLAHLQINETQAAHDDLSTAQRLDPNSFEASLGLGRALLAEGKAGDAYIQFLHTEALVTNNAQAAALFYWRAQSLEALGEITAAIADWQALLELPTEVVPSEWQNTAESHLLAMTPTTLTPTHTSTGTSAPIASATTTRTPSPTSTRTATPSP